MCNIQGDQCGEQHHPRSVEALPRARRVLREEGLWAAADHAVTALRYRYKCWKCRRHVRRLPAQMSVRALLDFVFGQPIAPWQIRSEIQKLVEIVAERRPCTVLEIGTASGGTLFLWTRVVHPEGSIISLDLPAGLFGGGYPEWKIPLYRAFALPGQEIHLLRADSHKPESVEQVKSLLAGRRIDFLFIDGDHTHDGIKQDFELYSPLLASGGVTAFHDIATKEGHENYGVTRFWHEVKQGRNAIEIVEQPPRGFAGIGVLLPPAGIGDPK